MRFCNQSAIATDGTVWFSETVTTMFGIDQWKDDFVQNADRPAGPARRRRRARGGSRRAGVRERRRARRRRVVRRGRRDRRAHRGPVVAHRAAGTRNSLVSDLPGYAKGRDNIARGATG